MAGIGQEVKGRKITGGRCYRQSRYVKEYIRERDNYTCQLCGGPGYDVDHIIPWHISHDSSPSNLRVLCHRCNLIARRYTLPEGRRRTLPLNEWIEYIRQELAKNLQ